MYIRAVPYPWRSSSSRRPRRKTSFPFWRLCFPRITTTHALYNDDNTNSFISKRTRAQNEWTWKNHSEKRTTRMCVCINVNTYTLETRTHAHSHVHDNFTILLLLLSLLFLYKTVRAAWRKRDRLGRHVRVNCRRRPRRAKRTVRGVGGEGDGGGRKRRRLRPGTWCMPTVKRNFRFNTTRSRIYVYA